MKVRIEAVNLQSFIYNGSTDHISCDVDILSYCKEIRNLSLSNFDLDDQSLEHLVFSLPLLESLALNKSSKLKHVKILSSSLKDLNIVLNGHNHIVEATIKTPNLVFFGYEGCLNSKFSISSSLSNQIEGNIKLVRLQDYYSTYYDLNWYIDLINFLSNNLSCFKNIDLHVYSKEVLFTSIIYLQLIILSVYDL